MSELVPLSTNVHQYQPQFSSIDDRVNPQYHTQNSSYQPWSPETSRVQLEPNTGNEETATKPCKQYLTSQMFMAVFVGLVICGIPLAVMTSLYVQKKNSPSTSETDTNSNSVSLPSQCSTYITNSDPTRLSTFGTCSNVCPYDSTGYFTAGWYRFTGGAGTQLARIPPSTSTCGASYPAWYNGTYPSTAGSTISSMICVHYNNAFCSPTYPLTVSITNCNGFYVYYLQPTSTTWIRYCTTL